MQQTPKTINRTMGTQTSERQVAKKHALFIRNSNSIYTYIPKNGCTNLRFAIVQANGDSAEQFSQLGKMARTYIASNDELALSDYKFVVYRCPFRRISSLFLDKVVSERYPLNKLRANSYSKIGAGLLPRTMGWLYNSNLISAIDRDKFTFRNFLSLLQHPGALGFNHHWTPQSCFGIEQLGLRYDDVFCLERFQEAIPIIEKKAQIIVEDVRDVSKHSAQGFSKITVGCFADTPVNDLLEIKQSKQIPAHSAMFDDSIIKMVNRLYRNDIELYRNHFGMRDLLFT